MGIISDETQGVNPSDPQEIQSGEAEVSSVTQTEADTEISSADTAASERKHYVPERILQYYDPRKHGKGCYEKSNIKSGAIWAAGAFVIAAAVAAALYILWRDGQWIN